MAAANSRPPAPFASDAVTIEAVLFLEEIEAEASVTESLVAGGAEDADADSEAPFPFRDPDLSSVAALEEEVSVAREWEWEEDGFAVSEAEGIDDGGSMREARDTTAEVDGSVDEDVAPFRPANPLSDCGQAPALLRRSPFRLLRERLPDWDWSGYPGSSRAFVAPPPGLEGGRRDARGPVGGVAGVDREVELGGPSTERSFESPEDVLWAASSAPDFRGPTEALLPPRRESLVSYLLSSLLSLRR